MDATLFVAAGIALGIVVGVVVTLVLVLALRHGQHAVEISSTTAPDGIDQVIEALESPAIVLDPSNTVVKASRSAFAFGLVSNQSLVHPELIALADRVRRRGEPEQLDDLVLPRGPLGEASLHVRVRVARLGVRYILVLADDRTEGLRLEEVRRDFVANISHELKTPIGAVGLLSEALVSASKEPEEVKRFAKRLKKEADRLAHITQEIIDLSRLQAADALADPSLVSIDDVVANAIDQNQVAADANRITVVSGGERGTLVYGDETLLTVAVNNLIANAVQYSPQSSRVGVGVVRKDGLVEIAVTDQGEGIPQAEHDRVFERFYRTDPARSRRSGGTGLGLSIVKHVAQNHGGDVSLWSLEGRGSTFTLRLPEAHPGQALAVEGKDGQA